MNITEKPWQWIDQRGFINKCKIQFIASAYSINFQCAFNLQTKVPTLNSRNLLKYNLHYILFLYVHLTSARTTFPTFKVTIKTTIIIQIYHRLVYIQSENNLRAHNINKHFAINHRIYSICKPRDPHYKKNFIHKSDRNHALYSCQYNVFVYILLILYTLSL